MNRSHHVRTAKMTLFMVDGTQRRALVRGVGQTYVNYVIYLRDI